MEDVLEVYKLPYNENVPVVCVDEANRQLIEETQQPRPTQPGQPALFDYEYIRNGVANFFMMFEPLIGRRQVKVTERRTVTDFAHCLRDLAETEYPDAQKIILVMDNLNTHSLASLYATFEPEQALRLAQRFEIHHTPKHGSWLNMAELEIGVMSRQCLNQRIPSIEKMKKEVQSWVTERNNDTAIQS
jgi:hypothetical protein